MQNQDSRPIFAAFDFDYTLINKDSLSSFILYSNGYLRTRYGLLILCPDFVKFLIGLTSRHKVKEKILTHFLGGRSIEEINRLGQKYADEILDSYLKPKALERLQWHQAQGHHCLLVSAAPELYLIPWAKRHGFEAVLASKLDLTNDGFLTGRLNGLNCWGQEKKDRLLEYLGPKENYQLYYYGDSRGDKDLLAIADFPFYKYL